MKNSSSPTLNMISPAIKLFFRLRGIDLDARVFLRRNNRWRGRLPFLIFLTFKDRAEGKSVRCCALSRLPFFSEWTACRENWKESRVNRKTSLLKVFISAKIRALKSRKILNFSAPAPVRFGSVAWKNGFTCSDWRRADYWIKVNGLCPCYIGQTCICGVARRRAFIV